MTRFWREGYWRTSVHGNRHWVEGHSVSRDDWDRYASSSNAGWFDLLRAERAHHSWFARYVNPNAACPVCSAPVFFFQNEFGSRVFFDELGPPWPKHPCTDASLYQGFGSGSIAPAIRDLESMEGIEAYSKAAGLDLRDQFIQKYGHAPAALFVVAARIRSERGTLLVLRPLNGCVPNNVLVICKRLARDVQKGLLVAVNKGALSYFDLAAMQEVRAPVERLRNAKAFVNELAAPKS
jgi:hypothetical protein